MSSPRRLKRFILADSAWRYEPGADKANLLLSKVTSEHTETTHIVLMIRAFMATEEWGRLKGQSPRRIDMISVGTRYV
ncbi:hypothetical protein FIBSPDRAFT_866677 [Athelia psychrophila]|uniref:Uncharacterized protein n=1 Tax=Athelia psychrophila TaxID=1759441 RepID=A0A166ENE3_9AGAM|nr:hypothetical protein FIBSPDRAFT_866677 [Fibularhizoctonia sp. CBS 109695]